MGFRKNDLGKFFDETGRLIGTIDTTGVYHCKAYESNSQAKKDQIWVLIDKVVIGALHGLKCKEIRVWKLNSFEDDEVVSSVPFEIFLDKAQSFNYGSKVKMGMRVDGKDNG